jgi:OHCU decarboxylase
MVHEQPFSSPAELIAAGERIWWSLEEKDWLEAFRSHPKIGERKAEQQTSAEAQKWSEQEQSGVQAAADKTKATLANLNSEYETKFGFIFIICATGKSSEEILSALQDRLKNDPEKELRIAAAEQARITSLRLEKLLRQ